MNLKKQKLFINVTGGNTTYAKAREHYKRE